MGKITKKNGKEWRDELPPKLWAHRTAKSQATGASPFSLVYGTEAIILIDLVRLAEIPREDILEVIEEKHDNVASHNSLYQASMKARHEGQVKERKFQVGELVWKTAPHVQGVAEAHQT